MDRLIITYLVKKGTNLTKYIYFKVISPSYDHLFTFFLRNKGL